LESLAYAGAFDCFKNIHRAQYFFMAAGDNTTALEKIIRFGNQYQAQINSSSNTLFGDLQMAEVVPPKLFDCEPWPLIRQLDYEKEVTGMFLSGHPLDNFKFELQHYNLTPIAEFNEFKESVDVQPNPGRIFRIAGLVADAQHKIAKSGNKYGVFYIEDFSSRMELNLFTDDYIKYHNYLEPGTAIFLTGNLRQRFNKTEYEFKVTGVTLLENLMKTCTKKLQIETDPKYITKELIGFMDENINRYPGRSTLKFCLSHPGSKLKVGLCSIDKGFEMNDEMAQYLQQKPELEVMVELT
jgi:DNA polymerase-3 subunit alpha